MLKRLHVISYLNVIFDKSKNNLSTTNSAINQSCVPASIELGFGSHFARVCALIMGAIWLWFNQCWFLKADLLVNNVRRVLSTKETEKVSRIGLQKRGVPIKSYQHKYTHKRKHTWIENYIETKVTYWKGVCLHISTHKIHMHTYTHNQAWAGWEMRLK